MKRLFKLTLLSSLILLFSCNKDKEEKEDTTVSGVITDASTQTPMENVVINITENELFNDPGSIIASYVTDASGAYNFTIDADPDNYYHVIIRENQNPDYFFLSSFLPGGGPYFTQKEVEANQSNHLSLNPATKANLSVVVEGDAGADSAEIFIEHEFISYHNFSGIWMDGGTSANYIPNEVASGKWFYTIKSYNGGIETTFLDSISLNKNQTLYDTLHF